jgi:hypothetical protein
VSKDGDVSQSQKTETTLDAWLIALGFVAVGAAMLWGSAYWHDHDGPETWITLVREIGALLFVTSAVTVFWDLRGKRALTREILAAARLSAEVDAAGLKSVSAPYIKLDWDELFSGACHVDLFFTYANTWRNIHATAMYKVAARSEARMRIVLPDPAHDHLVATIAARFALETEDLRKRIENAIEDLHRLMEKAATPTVVELRLTGFFPAYSYYRFDGHAVMTPFAQVPGRFEVPTFEFGGEGFLFDFDTRQFDALWEDAKPSEPSANITS